MSEKSPQLSQDDFVKLLLSVEPEAARADFDNDMNPDPRRLAYELRELQRRVSALEVTCQELTRPLSIQQTSA
jgi:hypothetical protein